VIILLKLKNKSEVAQIFLLLNFANVYILFSDYSANVHFLKNAIANGGISDTHTHQSILTDIGHYLGIKTIVFALGFLIWICICFNVPLLKQHILPSIFSYIFIIGHNLNFYWMYMSSKKEYLFILSNFMARLLLLLLLLLFIHFSWNLSYVMILVGIGNTLLGIFFYKNFCRIYQLKIDYTLTTIKDSIQVMKKDLPLVLNSFLLMSPSTCATFFIGFIKNTELVLVYGLAEKVFFAFRAMLGVFVNSIYPVFCDVNGVSKKKTFLIYGGFYVCVLVACASTYFIAPLILNYFHLPNTSNQTFYTCIYYFLATVVVISLNTPLFIWLLLKHQLNTSFATLILFIAAALVVAAFKVLIFLNNDVVFITQSLLASESIIIIAYLVVYFSKRKTASATFKKNNIN